jgi:phosphoribosylformylglycinamidine synthase
MHAVAEGARNVACAGARPWAATNCLNFGNPEKPEVMWEFSEAVDGMAEACGALGIPITGGNVSFYNETLGQSIYPTPVLGVLGLIEDASRALGMAFCGEGDAIILLDGSTGGAGLTPEERAREFSSSEYAKTIRNIVAGTPPAIDLAGEKRLIECLVALAKEGLARSAHDTSDGGLGVTLAECCFAATENFGAEITLDSAAGSGGSAQPAEWALFQERGARAVVSVSRDALARSEGVARQYGLAAREIGRVTRGEFRIQYNGRTVVRAGVESLRDAWANALERALSGKIPR